MLYVAQAYVGHACSSALTRRRIVIERQRGKLGDTQRRPEVIAGTVIRMDKQGSQSLCCDYAAVESGGTDWPE